MFESVTKKLRGAKKIVFVTGAGISQESGIPTFRGKDGLWRNYDAMKLATINAFYDNPKLVWEWYNERRKNIFSAEPNLGHKAIAELEKFVKVVVLTQNIDGLHQRAGSTEVLELHGSIVKIKCTVCDFKNEILTEFIRIPPLCKCGNILRPDVVWFGESLPQEIWQQAMIHASKCDDSCRYIFSSITCKYFTNLCQTKQGNFNRNKYRRNNNVIRYGFINKKY